MMRDIGKNIRDLRQQKHLTQEELAEQLFVTRQTVSNYENGRTRPDVDQILRLAEIFDTDAGQRSPTRLRTVSIVLTASARARSPPDFRIAWT